MGKTLCLRTTRTQNIAYGEGGGHFLFCLRRRTSAYFVAAASYARCRIYARPKSAVRPGLPEVDTCLLALGSLTSSGALLSLECSIFSQYYACAFVVFLRVLHQSGNQPQLYGSKAHDVTRAVAAEP